MTVGSKHQDEQAKLQEMHQREQRIRENSKEEGFAKASAREMRQEMHDKNPVQAAKDDLKATKEQVKQWFNKASDTRDTDGVEFAGQVAPSPTVRDQPAGTVCVDLNRAPRGELQRIAHIGAERVDELIAHRPYDTLDDLQRIAGIGPARIDQIRAEGLAATSC